MYRSKIARRSLLCTMINPRLGYDNCPSSFTVTDNVRQFFSIIRQFTGQAFPRFLVAMDRKGGKKKKECKMCHEDGTLRARRFFRTASGSSTYLDESSSRTRRRRLKGNHPLLPANSTASIPSELVKRGGGEVNIRESNVLL